MGMKMKKMLYFGGASMIPCHGWSTKVTSRFEWGFGKTTAKIDLGVIDIVYL
jgi:hypothetical protein